MRRGAIKPMGRNRHPGQPMPPANLDQILEPALMSGGLATVRAILDKMNGFGVSQAHLAAVSADAESLDKVQARSVATPLRWGGGFTAAHLAAANPDATRLAALLKLEPAGPSLFSESRAQPVHVAAACEGPGPLKLLLELGADRRSPGPQKRTPLHVAAAAGRAENVRLLMGGNAHDGADFSAGIRVLLLRQPPPLLKIGADGARALSGLLADLLQRLLEAARAKLGIIITTTTN